MTYHVAIAGSQEGPLAEADVRQRIAAGRLGAGDLCWREGWADWKPVREVFPEWFAAQQPPPLAGVAPAAPAPADPVASLRQPVLPAPAAAPARGALSIPRTEGTAIASLVLGSVSVFFCLLTGIPAIVCGHVALGRIRRAQGALEGTGLAIAGLALGYLGIVFTLLFLPAMAIPAVSKVRETARYTVSSSNLRQVVQAGLIFAMEHDGALPSTLEELGQAGLSDPKAFDLPYTSEVESDGYAIVPGLTTAMEPDTIFCYERIARRDGTVAVGRLGGHVTVLSRNSPELGVLPEGAISD